MVHYLPLKTIDQIQLEELNFLCLYLHRCKEFISCVASKTRTCGGVMWVIGWRKGYNTLEILGQYRCQESIDNNPKGYEELMVDSSKAGKILSFQVSIMLLIIQLPVPSKLNVLVFVTLYKSYCSQLYVIKNSSL
jgi:hypothetical protein